MLTRRRLRALLASAAGAATFLVLGIPLPLLLGPVAGCLVVSLAGLRLQDLGQFGIFVRTFLGVAIGTAFTPEIVANIPDTARSLVFIPPFILVIGLTGFLLFRRIGFDRQTAFYAAMPGGLQDMLNLGEQAGGNVRAKSLIHATRVPVISSLVPFAITVFWGLDLNRPPGKPAIDIPLHEIAIMILAGIGGWQIAGRIGIPGSSIIGPLILTACRTLSGLIDSRPPAEIDPDHPIHHRIGSRGQVFGINGRRTAEIRGRRCRVHRNYRFPERDIDIGNYIDYLTTHHAARFRSISRVTGVANANAPRRAEAPIPNAMMLRAAFRSA